MHIGCFDKWRKKDYCKNFRDDCFTNLFAVCEKYLNKRMAIENKKLEEKKKVSKFFISKILPNLQL